MRVRLATKPLRRLPSTLQDPFRERRTGWTVLNATVNLFWTVGTALAMIAPVIGMMWAGPPKAPQTPEAPSGSGIILRTEVTAVWMPRALRDLARHQVGPLVDRSPEELQTYLGRDAWKAAWYALTYRAHRVNGESEEITQIRRLSEATDHLDEFHAVMATAAGTRPRYEGRDFSHARVEVIPDTMQAFDPREAITRQMAEPVLGE
jgi:hypothetical protein